MAREVTPIQLPVAATPMDESIWTRVLAVGSRSQPVALVAIAAAAPVALAVGLLPLRGQIPSATVALGLAVLVSALAAIGGRMPAAIAAVSAALSFDGFFTRPYGSISISSPGDVETTVLLLVGGLIVGQLSARNREHRMRVSQSSDNLARIQAVAEMLASGRAAHDVVAAIAAELQAMLGLRNCWFDASLTDAVGPTIERNGDVSWGRIWWGFDTLGLPGKQISLGVENQHHQLGRFVLLAEPGTRVSRQQLLAAVTLADQAGTALGVEAESA
jgi:K+-sensing histidine kinase KdpD